MAEWTSEERITTSTAILRQVIARLPLHPARLDLMLAVLALIDDAENLNRMQPEINNALGMC